MFKNIFRHVQEQLEHTLTPFSARRRAPPACGRTRESGALVAGLAGADFPAPFARGVATFGRPGSGRTEPTATPRVAATNNTVILRITSSTRVMAASDSAARRLQDRSKCLTTSYPVITRTIKLLQAGDRSTKARKLANVPAPDVSRQTRAKLRRVSARCFAPVATQWPFLRVRRGG